MTASLLWVLQSANKAVDVAEYKKVSHLGTLEGEDGHARPPDVAAGGRHSKQFLAMKTVESHLAADVIAFLDHRSARFSSFKRRSVPLR
jgi:hypothetical protein